MKSNHMLTRSLIVLLTTIYLPVTLACDQVNENQFENLLSISTDSKISHNDTESYKFKDDNCYHAKNTQNNHRVNSHIDQEKVSSNSYKLSQMVAR